MSKQRKYNYFFVIRTRDNDGWKDHSEYDKSNPQEAKKSLREFHRLKRADIPVRRINRRKLVKTTKKV